MRRFSAAAAVAASTLVFTLGAAVPTIAASDTGQLGTVSFPARGTSLTSSGIAALNVMSADLKSTSALRVEAYGGPTSVTKSTAKSRAAARAAAVQAWLKSKGIGGTVTVVNRGRWTGAAGSDNGNRVVLFATAKKVTFTVTSDSMPDDNNATVCNFTVTSATSRQGVPVGTASVKRATSACTWTVTMSSLTVGRPVNVSVAVTCNDAGDGTPADDVCSYAQSSSPWVTPDAQARPAGATTLTATLSSVNVTGKTASVGTLPMRMVVN